MPGPAPKPASKRRRRNTPKSYGAATPITAQAAEPQDRELGVDDPHELVVSLWAAVQSSCESVFYSEADWQRLRLELWYANKALTGGPVSGRTWAVIQRGLSDLLVSPAVKRRAGIEMQRGVDADAVAATELVAKYKRVLKSV